MWDHFSVLQLLLMVFGGRAAQDERSDEELMEAYRDENDVHAFEVLLARWERKLFNFIFRMVGDREKANDLTQEAFLRVVKGRKRYTRQAKFSTWLYTIGRNQAIDALRKARFRRHKSLDQPRREGDDSRTLMDKLPGDSPDGLTRTDASEVTARVAEALEDLSEDQREVFVMREFQGMPFKAIAEVVGVSENTIKSRMRYALEKLRLALADYAPELPGDVDPVPARSRV